MRRASLCRLAPRLRQRAMDAVLCLALLLVPAPPAQATSTSYRTVGAVVSPGGFWTGFTLANLDTSDAARATTTTDSDYGVVSTFDFGVPTASTILGVAVYVEASRNAAGTTVDYAVQLSWDGGVSWTAAKADNVTSATDFIDTLGGGADTWGRTWSGAELADASFQLRIYRTGGTGTLRVDHIRAEVFYQAPSGDMQVESGTYPGDGVNGRSIPVGFRPDMVIVKAVPNQPWWAVVRTSSMTGNFSRTLFWNASNPLTDAIQSLDPTGFTVGNQPEVNNNGTTYHWVAFRAAAGQMEVGSYDGDGSDDRNFTGLGFQPEYVMVLSEGLDWTWQRFAGMADDQSETVEGGNGGDGGVDNIQRFLADGFQIGTDGEVNANTTPATRFYWVAWNDVPGHIKISSYTGGAPPDGRSIGSVGFRPEYVFVAGAVGNAVITIGKPASTGVSTDTAQPWGGWPNAPSVSDSIQALEADGFQIGANLNTVSDVYYYAAFAPQGGTQAHYRWRNDDGSEVAATWAAGEDTAFAGVVPGSPLRVRLEVSNEGDNPSNLVAYQLQVAQAAVCGTATYSAVPTDTSGHWQIVGSPFLTDGSATTDFAGSLTNEATAFVAGEVKEAGNATSGVTLSPDAFTEIEFSVQATANAAPGGSYCFRLYDSTNLRALEGYQVYPQASLPALTLANLPAGQVPDQLGVTTPVTATFFQLRLSRAGTVTVDNLRVRFTITGGVANGDVTAGDLWEDTNGNGTWDGPDTLIQGSVTPSGGVLTFTTDFSPAPAGTNYFVRATLSNLAAGDTTTFSVAAADIDEVEAAVGEAGTISDATHVEDFASGGDVYYSIGTSIADLKTGSPTIAINNGTATLSVTQTGYVGVGDRIEYAGGPVFIKTVLNPTAFVVHTATGLLPANTGAVAVTNIRREFNTIAAAVTGSVDGSHLGNGNLVGNTRKLTWVCYNDGPFNVAVTTTISGYTTNATYYITLTVAGAFQVVNGVSHRHNGTAGSGAVVEAGAIGGGAPVFNIAQAYTQFEWLEIDGNSFVSQDGIYVTGSNSLLRYLIVHDVGANDGINCANGTNGCSSVIVAGVASSVAIRNSFIYDYGQDGIDSGGTGTVIANTTLFRTKQSGEGLQITGGTTTAENVLSLGNFADFCAQDFCSGTLTCNNCFSSDGSADNFPGTGSLINRVAANQLRLITGPVDLHLKAGADALGAGKDLSGTFTDDIDSQTRTIPWDVGADEFQGASGQMRVTSGTYTGDGVGNRAIYVGFQPDVVVVKRDENGPFAMVRTSTMPDLTKAMDIFGSAAFAGGIESLDATGFTLGTDADVNGAGATFYWVALEAAPGEVVLGSYTGDGADNRSITGTGFRPDYVWVLPMAARPPYHRSSAITGDSSYDFDATQQANRIQMLEANGFQVGTDFDVNQAGGAYHYVAWRAVAGRMAVGSYVGTGVDNRDLDLVGFIPEWALVKRSGNFSGWVQKPASTGINTDYSVFFNDTVGQTNDIQQLRPLGFQVGLGGEATDRTNENGVTYFYVAFGPHPAGTNYRSIGDTTVTYGTAGTTGAGTRASVTNGSATVSGLLGTTWSASNRGRGDVITIPCDNPPACTLPAAGVHYMIHAVTADNLLQLSRGYQGATDASVSYVIRRQFSTLQAWESCISGAAPTCNNYFPVTGGNLVTEDRSEIGIAYEDATFTTGVTIDGSTTDATHTITLTADGSNRHYGLAGQGVVVDNTGQGVWMVDVLDDFVTVEWLELSNGDAFFGGIRVATVSVANSIVLRNNLIHDTLGAAIRVIDPDAIVDVIDNVVYGVSGTTAIWLNVASWTGSAQLRLFNNTIFDSLNYGVYSEPATNAQLVLRNNIAHGSGIGGFEATAVSSASSDNLASDTTGISHSPAGGGLDSVPLTGAGGINFVSTTAGSENLHLQSTSLAIDAGANLSSLFWIDIDAGGRAGTWDIGADEFGATTEVELLSFEARPLSGAVELSWETGSELNNLGFHVYRGALAAGPWERLTANLIPGLGSSPQGARYVYRDSGLSNGATYYYLLEDVETTGRVERHGPVEATPNAQASPADETLPPAATTYGDPEATFLRVVSRRATEMRVELATGGFYAFPREDGTVEIAIPGFTPSKESPGLPVKLHWLEAVAGRKVEILSVRAGQVEVMGLVPSAASPIEIEASQDGTQKLRRSRTSRASFQSAGLSPEESARIAEVAFQGDAKKALLELAPLRWDAGSKRLLFARTLQVTLSFRKREPAETARANGRRGRRERATAASRGIVARLATVERGLYGVRYEEIFRETRGQGVDGSTLRLSRLGKAVAFHLQPPAGRFAPGSTLYFLSDGPEANPYGNEAVYELETGRAGTQMRAEKAAPAGESIHEFLALVEREEDRYYQAALLDAPDLWLWDLFLAPSLKAFPFPVSSLASSDTPAKLEIFLQGASDFPESPDHHARLSVNGTYLAEEEWNGKEPRRVEIVLPAGILKEGENSLEVEGLADTGALYSMFFLDRFQVTYPRLTVAANGIVSGTSQESGTAEVSAIGDRARVLDVSGPDPRWLTGAGYEAGSLRFRVEAGRSYLVIDPSSVKRPEVRKVLPAQWKKVPPRVDYVAIGPRELLDAARPLLDQRRDQGLAVASVSINEIFDEMGYGERRPEAIRDFLTYAYHHWPGGIRYVLLLGDASYDFKDHLGTGSPNQVPALPIETSYLWTASDPSLAAVNGDDLLPDVAIGRLPAADAPELRSIIDKILAYETGESGLTAPVVLVTDNPDVAGDFDADALDLTSSVLASRPVRHISLAALGAERTRESILEAFDEGASVVSYMGHGGIHLWASENVLNNDSVPLLAPQGQQPIVNALDCLNGYFHFPFFDSLAEELLKADAKGAIAVFAPSGLSLNEPAHELHKALLQELFEGGHARLGDAVLAAQAKFLDSGSLAELLTIYHLFGDPALRLK